MKQDTIKKETFTLSQDGETLIFEGNEALCKADWESESEMYETETFFDWCKNSYPATKAPSTNIEQREGFTGGEWKYKWDEMSRGKLLTIFTENNPDQSKMVIGEVLFDKDMYGAKKEEAEANAALISAAPEMYKLIQWISRVTNSPEIGIKCDAMLKKANPKQ